MPKITIQYAKDCIIELTNMAKDIGEFRSGELNTLNSFIYDLNQAIEQERGEYIENDASIAALNEVVILLESRDVDEVVEFVEDEDQFEGLSDLTSNSDRDVGGGNNVVSFVTVNIEEMRDDLFADFADWDESSISSDNLEYDDLLDYYECLARQNQEQEQDSPADVVVSESGGILSTLASIFCCFCIYAAQVSQMNGCVSEKGDEFYDQDANNF